MGECLQNRKIYGGKVYFIANNPRGNIYYTVNIPGGRFAMRMVYYTTPEHNMLQPHNSFSCQKLAYEWMNEWMNEWTRVINF
jgi:hypothetical protein